ncbi:VPLPA-CTERM protein sorting domain-containing protein [Cognatiyoonia sediminum]|uniref:VPLPA-CTERM protein sorting domain-containing protein n=1 Tax=Cognatiyoonia sediminum TaxID=1508389 RepID=A0A1M5M8H2_9RHOB|nr:VPLPA-CTERM sorting domain-containing protein [Cognatiyoonia sediminum]SHG73624.1 VPLPA-CTERM protein sorting domain-containing protein [Cognatiyoonia sediminum]
MNIKHLLISSAIAIPLAATSATASTVSFDVDGPGSEAFISGQLSAGAAIFAEPSADLDNEIFDLGVGDSYSFDFIDFSIVDVESFIGGGLFAVEATLAFEAPGGSVSDSGFGGFGTFAGFLSGGVLEWTTGTQQVSLDDGTVFTVELEEGSVFGFGNSATAQATVTLDVAPVPLPASSLLLLAGLSGLGIAARRKRAA